MRFDPFHLLRPLLFRLDAETAHDFVFTLGGAAQRVPLALRLLRRPSDARLARDVLGLHFNSPIGLAAGMDKNARLLPLWDALGFGFVEIGTVTPRPQPGNRRPRLFRSAREGLILNRMGFNNEGAEAVARRLERRPPGLIVGGNIGKNKDTPDEDAAADYRQAYRLIGPRVDYAVVNVSSPNTPGLRALQAPAALVPILAAVLDERDRLGLGRQPVLVKLAPDLADEELAASVEVAIASGADGIVATNTTVDRELVPARARAQVEAWGEGGISGDPLYARAAAVRRRVHELLGGRGALVASGGIRTGEQAVAALAEGASLVQVYAALVFEGPGIARRLNRAIVEAR